MSPLADDHDLGLHHDLLTMAAQLRARRAVLGMMMGSGATLLAGCGGGADSGSSIAASSSSSAVASSSSSSASSSSSSTASAGSCVQYSSETNGPYPADGSNTVGGSVSNVLTQSGVVRSDIRASFGSSSNLAAACR